MTNKFSTVSIAVLATFLASGAYAADINGGSSKDTGIFGEAPKNVNWTGFYIGGRLGYGHANHELAVEEYRNGREAAPATCKNGPVVPREGNDKCDGSDNENFVPAVTAIEGFSEEIFGLNGLDSSGITGGGQLGADIQRGRFVFGVFGSYDMSGAETTVSAEGIEAKLIEKGDEWSLGARAGLLVNPRTLAYVLAAYTESEFTFAGIGEEGGSKDVTFSGVTIGGGVEFAVTNNIFFGVEGTHTFYGKETLIDDGDGEPGSFGTRLTDEIGETKVMGTLKVKLNSGLPSLSD